MDYGDLTKKELLDILELVHKSTMCSTEAGLKSLMSALNDLVTAENAICALVQSSGQIVRLVNLNYPEEWVGAHSGGDFGGNGPEVRHDIDPSKPFFWSGELKEYSVKWDPGLMNIASGSGLRYGIAGGVKSTGKGAASMFSFSGRQNRFTGRHLNILGAVTPHLHDVLLKLAGGVNGAVHGLSAREMEVLGHMKRGVSYIEISGALKISVRTVKYHAQSIKEKLDAVNKAHAIAIAADFGL